MIVSGGMTLRGRCRACPPAVRRAVWRARRACLRVADEGGVLVVLRPGRRRPQWRTTPEMAARAREDGHRNETEGPAGSRGVPVGCLALGILALGLVVVLSIPPCPPRTVHGECMKRMSLLRAALRMYREENENAYPPAGSWPGVVATCVPDESRSVCPAADEGHGAYAYNSALSGVAHDAISEPWTVVAIFESDRARPAAGGPELLPREPRHRGGDHYCFAEALTSRVPRGQLGVDAHGNPMWAKRPDPSWEGELRWEPLLEGDAEAE
jgi:hypothetical protein